MWDLIGVYLLSALACWSATNFIVYSEKGLQFPPPRGSEVKYLAAMAVTPVINSIVAVFAVAVVLVLVVYSDGE